MDFMKTTKEYYSKWIGRDQILNQAFHGIQLVYSQERNRVQSGYSQRFDLYVFCQPQRIIISYGDKAASRIRQLKNSIGMETSTERLAALLSEQLGGSVERTMKYVFDTPAEQPLRSRILTNDDFNDYYSFFLHNHPNCKNTDWIQAYFETMSQPRLCCGLFLDGVLVSCTDAPTMPYLKDKVQEIGIYTRSGYCGKGYAADVCSRCIKEIIRLGKCPQWSTSSDNIASQKLALRIGFAPFAQVITVTLPQNDRG